MILPAGVYRHYKGGLYQILGIGQHTETNEIVVVYVALTGANLPGPRIRVRPLEGPEGFMTPVEGGVSYTGSLATRSVDRFTYIGTETLMALSDPAAPWNSME